LAAVIRT